MNFTLNYGKSFDTAKNTKVNKLAALLSGKTDKFSALQVGYSVDLSSVSGAAMSTPCSTPYCPMAGSVAIALIDTGQPVFIVVPTPRRPTLHAKVVSNIQEVRARGARILSIAPGGPPNQQRCQQEVDGQQPGNPDASRTNLAFARIHAPVIPLKPPSSKPAAYTRAVWPVAATCGGQHHGAFQFARPS